MKFCITDFLSTCDQIRIFLKKSLTENFIFCVILSLYLRYFCLCQQNCSTKSFEKTWWQYESLPIMHCMPQIHNHPTDLRPRKSGVRLVSNKKSHILKQIILKATGLLKYVWPFSQHQALKGLTTAAERWQANTSQNTTTTK